MKNIEQKLRQFIQELEEIVNKNAPYPKLLTREELIRLLGRWTD